MRWTAHGVPVLVHDVAAESPMQCTGGEAHPAIAKTTYAVLSRDCRTSAYASPQGGCYSIPRVEGVAQKLAQKSGAQWLLEIKTLLTAKQEDELFDLLQRHSMVSMVQRTMLTSFFPAELVKARAEARQRGLAIRLMLFTSSTGFTAATAAKDGLWGVAIATDALSKSYVSTLHARHVKALEWTPNTPAHWQRATDAGIEPVVTDEPIAWQRWDAHH